MPDIIPDPGALGITSIKLGPWFTEDVNLASPLSIDLSVPISAGSGEWLPPANGLLSLILPRTTVVDGETLPHRSLVHLKKADGTLRFGDDLQDKMVALFTLLPEVHIRLQQLYLNHRNERLGSRANQSPKRLVPYQFALEVDKPNNLATLNEMVDAGDEGITSDDHAATLGMTFNESGFQNANKPMSWFRKPTDSDSPPYLLRIPETGASLLVFNQDGFPMDPGMVVSVFTALTEEYDNLWGGSDSTPSFPTTDDIKTLHFVTPFGKAPESDWLSSLRVNGDEVEGEGAVASFEVNDSGLELSYESTALDDQPFLRHAILPYSPYQTTSNIPSAELFDRDYIRVSLIDLEQLLTGQTRTPPFDNTDKNWQALPSTRINLAKSTTTGTDPVFLTHHEAVLHQADSILRNGDPAIILTSQWNGGNGAIGNIVLPDAELPDKLSDIRLLPVQGGAGPDDPEHPTMAMAMQAVLQVDLDSGLTDAWVCALPLGFDLDTGIRSQMRGAGGKAISIDGVARATILVTLPLGDATVDADDVVAFDVEIVTDRGKRLLGAQTTNRVNRPPAIPGAIAITDTSFPDGVNALYVCETGQRIQSGAPLQLPPGLTLLAELPNNEFAVIDTKNAPYDAFNNSLGQQLTNAHVLVTTDRIWRDDPQGDADALIPDNTVTVNSGRNKLENLTEAGAPIPLMERNENLVVSARVDNANGLLSGTALVRPFHELNPPRPGQAGQPAQADIHAVGVQLQGPAAALLHEVALDRRFKGTPELISDVIASTFPIAPTDSTDAQPMVAALRTVAAQVEGEIQMHIHRTPSLLNNIADYNYTHSLANKQSHVNGISPGLLTIPDLPPPSDAAGRARMERYLDRRVRGATQGYQEVVPTLKYWIEQAQQFIYIETPVLSAGLDLQEDDELRLIQIIRNSLVNNPNLYVLICLPLKVDHPFQAIRQFLTSQNQRAMEQLRPVRDETTATTNPTVAYSANNRIAFMSPYGPGYRPLDIKTTTVIVDDVVALSGPLSLSRRGLTFDASVAAAVFDERIQVGRSQEVFSMRQSLIADRLRLDKNLLPEKGSMLVSFVRDIIRAGFNQNITRPQPPSRPDLGTGDSFAAQFDPDGRFKEGFDVSTYLTGVIANTSIENALAD